MTLRSAHLYQIMAYLAAAASDLPPSACVLYAADSDDLDESMVLNGHPVRLASLNLAAPWRRLVERLLDVVRWRSEESSAHR